MTTNLSRLKQPHMLLNHILDQPELVGSIRNLTPGALSRLIHHIGLEDSGELVSLATIEQLERIFDEDLWRSNKPGEDETFDAERFALWLEIMLESGPVFAARKIADLDEDLITLALCKLILVIDLDELSMRMSSSWRLAEDDLLDKELENCLCQEFGEYLVISKNHLSWESICTVLVELNEQNYRVLIRLLERCCHISSEYIEDNGSLYDVLTSGEMLESDMAAQREERRESMGYISPSTAVSFLSLARITSLQEHVESRTRDPITRTYFRAGTAETESAIRDRSAAGESVGSAAVRHPPGVIGLLQTLQAAEVFPEPARKKLADPGGSMDAQPLLTRAIRAIKLRDEDLYSRLVEEISFLSNVLVAGCSFAGRCFRPAEALEAALAVCNIGSEHILGIDLEGQKIHQVKRVELLLADQDLIKLFKVGWKILHTDVLLYAVRVLQNALNRIGRRIKDRRQTWKLTHLFSALEAQVTAGKPWLLRSELDQLGDFLDGTTVMAFMALLNEYPTMPTGIGEHEQTRKLPFISTIGQIHAIQRFLKHCGVANPENDRDQLN